MAKRGRYGAGSYYSAQLKNGETRHWWIAPASRTGKRQKSPRFSEPDKLEDWIGEFRRSSGASARRGTFDQAAEAWLNDSRAAEDKLSQMRGTVNNHFLPVFGGRQLADITTQDVTAYVTGKAAGTLPVRGNAKTKLGKTTVHMHAGWIRSIYEYAIKHGGYYGKNPAGRVESKKLSGLQPTKQRPKTVGDRDIAKLIATAPPQHRAHIAVMALCGLRSQEAAGLYWDDWSRSTLRVTRARKAATTELDDLKTIGSIRDIPLSEQVNKLLRQQYRYLESVGLPNKGQTLMFPDSTGGVIDPHNFRRALRKIARDAGIKQDVTPHMFRHSAATGNLREKPLAEVSALLGHANKKTTLDIYVHSGDISPVREIELDPKKARSKARAANYTSGSKPRRRTSATTSGVRRSTPSAEA
jgi:integrase